MPWIHLATDGPALPSRLPATANDSPYARRTLRVATAGTMLVLAVFSAFVVTIADSALQVGAGPTGEAWALSGMSLGLAAALLTAGAMADDLGHGKVLTGSAVLASVVGGLGWRGRRGHHPRDRLRLPHSRQRLAGEAGSG